MVELYNDQLLDLFDKSHSAKLDIKKDKKGWFSFALIYTLKYVSIDLSSNRSATWIIVKISFCSAI